MFIKNQEHVRRISVIIFALVLFFCAVTNDSFVYAQSQEGAVANLDGIQLTRGTDRVANMSRRVTAIVSAKVSKIAILVDGEPIAYCPNRQAAQRALVLLKQKYSNDNAAIKSVSFLENVTIDKVKVALDDFNGYLPTSDLLAYIEKGTLEKNNYFAKSGDTFLSVAQANNMTVEDLLLANPKLAEQKYLTEGQVISLIVPRALIHVKTVDSITYETATDFEVIEEGTDKLFEGEFDVKVKGEKGKSSFVAERVLINGVESERDIVSETVIVEPKSQVLTVGTKKAPPKKGTGVFVRPARSYVITSPFGERRSYGIHTGIDLAMPIGRDITAADGGVVTFASYRGTYGNLVIIDHGDRKKTYYAHCSKLLVKPGDKVFQGQRVALSGSSGRSTGPHLHFEFRIDDVPVNPIKYVNLR